MNVTILRCNDCNSIMVVNNKDLWKIKRCNNCESGNLALLEEEIEDNE